MVNGFSYIWMIYDIFFCVVSGLRNSKILFGIFYKVVWGDNVDFVLYIEGMIICFIVNVGLKFVFFEFIKCW